MPETSLSRANRIHADLPLIRGSFAAFLASRLRSSVSSLSYLALTILGVGLTSLLAQLTLPIPGAAAPFTCQSLGVLLTSAVLGARRGSIASALYVLIGTLGVPVFAGGTAGSNVLFGPHGGYLIGFIVASAIVGALADQGRDRRFATAVGLFCIGHVVIYLVAIPWLAGFVGVKDALMRGALPFVPGAILKALLGAAILPLLWRTVAKLERYPNLRRR